MSKLINRIKFAFKYDVPPEFIVVPFGEPYEVWRFTKYEDAERYAKKMGREKPMFGRPDVLVIVKKRGKL